MKLHNRSHLTAAGIFICIFAVLFAMAFVPLPSAVRADTPVEVNAGQIMILGVVASALVFLLNSYTKSQGKKISREVLTVIVYGLSVILALAWSAPSLPALPSGTDISVVSSAYIAFGLVLLEKGAGVLGFATLLYNWLLKSIDEKYFSQPVAIGPDAESLNR